MEDALLLTADFAGVPVAILWSAWTEKERLLHWWPKEADLSLAVGGTFHFRWPDSGISLRGRYLSVEPASKLAFTFALRNHFDEFPSVVVLDFSATQGGSRLTIHHSPFLEPADSGVLRQLRPGWLYWIDSLRTYLGEAPSSDK